MGISTHVLDTARGKPAQGIRIALERFENNAFVTVGGGTTDKDGRVKDLLTASPDAGHTYRVTFELSDYFRAQGTPAFYPRAQVEFVIGSGGEHYHVPLLLSPFGFSTYRGS